LLKGLIFQTHRWVGLTLGLLVFIVCFSGTLAVFAPELDWAFNEKWRVPVEESPYDWDSIYNNVRERYPSWSISFILGPRHEGFAAQVLAKPVAGEYVNVLVNPYNGQIQGVTSYWNLWRFFRSFHRRLMVENPAGLLLVTVLGLSFLVSLVTGLISYKKWWRYLFRLRVNRNARVFWGDFHKLLGIWSLWIGLVIALTGAWYFVELFAPAESPPVPKVKQVKSSQAMTDLNGAVEQLRSEFPTFSARRMLFLGGNQPIHVGGQTEQWLLRDRSQGGFVDPRSGTVLATHTTENMNIHQYISEIADPLHFGTWGGITTQIIWFVVGLGLSAGSLTGTLIWFRRTRRTKRGPATLDRTLYGAGLGLTLIIVLFSTWGGIAEARLWMHLENPAPIELGTVSLAGSRAKLYGVDGNKNDRIDQVVVQSRNPEAIIFQKRMNLNFRGNGESHSVELKSSSYSRFSGKLNPEVSVRELLDQSVSVGDASVEFHEQPVLETTNTRHGQLHPGHQAVPIYVWIFISAFVLLILSAYGFWAWVLIG